MSTFDSLFRSSGVANLAQLESEIESSLPARVALAYIPGGVQSTSGTSVILSQSFTMQADEVAILMGRYSCSASLSSSIIVMTSTYDGGSQVPSYNQDMRIASDGLGSDGLCLSVLQDPLAGSHTFGMSMTVTGGGTGYAANLYAVVLAFKRRS